MGFRQIANRDWTTDDGRFDFNIIVLQDESKRALSVSIVLYQTALIAPNRIWIWEGENLPIGVEIPLNNVITKDGYTLKGFVKWYFENSHGTDLIVWADFEVYKEEVVAYEFVGPIFVEELGAIPIPIDPEPDPPFVPGGEEVPPAEGLPVVTPARYEDLFPYIYMDIWPELDELHDTYGFLKYKAASNKFYTALKGFKKSKDREKMLSEAAKFIQGDGSYKNQYIEQWSDLKGHIARFLSVVDTIGDSFENLAKCIVDELDSDFTKFKKYLKDKSYLEQKENLWNSYFALVIELGYQYKWLDQVTRILVAINFIETIFNNLDKDNKCTLTAEQLILLRAATILLPDDILPLPPFKSANKNGDNPTAPTERADAPPVDTWIEPYAIGNLQLVKQRLLKYEPGELAEVISVLPGEKKEIVKRKLNRTSEENQSENSQSLETLQQTDETTNDLSSEVKNTLAQRTDNYTYTDLKTTYGPPTNITMGGSWKVDKNYLDSKNKEVAQPDVKIEASFARNILNTTQKRMSEVVSRKRFHALLNETEETTTSVFDNTNKELAINGKYFWLNKIYEAQVINYGNRLMISFMVSRPADTLIKKEWYYDNQKLDEPISPEQKFNIVDFNDIHKSNYLKVCAYYGIDQPPTPPKYAIIQSGSLEGNESKSIVVPEGYEAHTAYISFVESGTSEDFKVSGLVGRHAFEFTKSQAPDDGSTVHKKNE